MSNDLISVIANVALALSFVVALVFGVTQVKLIARDRRERLTLETIKNFQSKEFAGLIYYLTNRVMPLSQDEFKAIPESEQVTFIQFAQQMEHLGILVKDKLIDIELVDKTLGSFVTSSWEKYKPMFLNMRVTLPDPFLGEYFQWLAESIEKRMREKPRPPVYEAKNH